MLFKKLFLLGLAAFFAQSGFAFTVINRTDSEKVLKIEEAYRPLSDEPGNLNMPVSLGHSHQFTVAANSTYTFSLTEPCSILLVGVITTSVEDGVETKVTNMTCHEAYDYQEDFCDYLTCANCCTGDYYFDAEGFKGCATCCEHFNEPFLTDNWGIVFHKPVIGIDSTLSPVERLSRVQDMALGYGLKCLDPKLLEKVLSNEL